MGPDSGVSHSAATRGHMPPAFLGGVAHVPLFFSRSARGGRFTEDKEVRQIASQNVIAVLGAKIDSQSARIDVKFSQIEAQITEVRAEMKAGFSEVNSRIDTLEKVVWRVIWPLIVLLAAPIFGLLYKALTS